jgi:carbamoyltransferase
MIISICDNHDSGAALIIDGKIISAISEERLNRIKLTRYFPSKSIIKLLEEKHVILNDIDLIIIGAKMTPMTLLRIFNKKYAGIKKISQFNYFLNLYIFYQVLVKIFFLTNIEMFFSKLFFKNKLRTNKKMIFIGHHESHAYSAYSTSGLRKALVITIDAMGDGVSVTLSIGNNGYIKRIFCQSGFSSIGLYYSRITEFLGFTPIKHEGKTTGLAAYGNPIYLIDEMKKNMHFCSKGFNLKNYSFKQDKNTGFYKKLKNFSREDIAAALQKNLEEEVCKFIEYWVNKTNVHDLALAGGLFANVKLNQKIHELNCVNSIYIFPHMGDGGLAVGAAFAYVKPNPFKLENVYFGPEYSNKDIKIELNQNKLKYYYFKNIESEIAKLLAKGFVVARFNGRMEFGPRALGNRSILYQTNDKTVNDWLNKKLKRTEFMPFAPATLKEYADKCYKNIKGAEYTAKFMTITFDCTDWMKENCPGVVHVDGTARPQILSRKDNPSFYKIIDEYRKITGIPSIINTSFNIHEEPIVCSPKDAVRAFRIGHLGYLAIGNYLVKNEQI